MEAVSEFIRAARAVKLTLGLGILLVAVAGALTLTRAPPRVVRVGAPSNVLLASGTGDATYCQANEVLPAGVSAIRLQLLAYFGAPVRVTASSALGILTEGRRGAGWTGSSVTVPVTPLSYTAAHVTLCIAVEPNSEGIIFKGVNTPPLQAAVSLTGERLGGRVGVEYLSAGKGSWWSRLPLVAEHIGIGHALTGNWVALLIVALMVLVGALTIRVVLSAQRTGATRARSGSPRGSPPRRIRAILQKAPTLAWLCALIAFLNAAAWSLIVPPFQGKDETDHFAYVEQLAENGTLPENGNENGKYSMEESLVLEGLDYYEISHSPQTPAISSIAQQRVLARDVNAGASLKGSGEAGVATSEPPLFYAIEMIPYVLARGNMLDQLQLMRLLGALFAAATALFVFLFLRELLPAAPWATTIGALCVALQPLLAFMSGSVNPDAMLFAVAAAVFFCLARAFRRGLTRRLAIALGVLIAVGFVTKLNFIGLACGVFAGLAVLAAREVRLRGGRALALPAIAAGIGISPVLLYVLRNILSSRSAFGIVAGTARGVLHLSYIWQLYLPRLPGMAPFFSGIATSKDIWFDRSVGLYGWMDTMFPTWVDDLALVPSAAIALLCVRELIVRRDALRARLPELGVYGAMTVGVLVMVGASSYVSDIVNHGAAFGEPRYLLPMLALLGGVIALAVRGAGRRWAPVAGAAIVIVFLGHDIFSQLQVVARYYG